VRADCAARSTGGPPLAYAPDMRKNALIAPTVLLTLFVAPGCKEETPANEPSEFGDPCVVGEANDTPDGCVAGHYCYLGYCVEECLSPSDCQLVDGWERECSAGICHVLCGGDENCPQDLGTPLVCEVVTNRCRPEEYE
jgi:hypothetical protein